MDELIKRLRHSANFAERGLTPPPSELRDAADAIEELTLIAESYKRSMEALADEAANAQPRWIPVTERLPEDDVHYVLCCGANGGMFVGWVAVRLYDGGDKATGGNGRNITHWMPLPEPPKEET